MKGQLLQINVHMLTPTLIILNIFMMKINGLDKIC